MKNIDNEQYVSLYDYRGHSSRDSGLGQKVYNAAKTRGIHVIYTDLPADRQREAYNRVATYPKSFLDEYFRVEPQPPKEINLEYLADRVNALEAKFDILLKKLETNVTNNNEYDDELPF